MNIASCMQTLKPAIYVMKFFFRFGIIRLENPCLDCVSKAAGHFDSVVRYGQARYGIEFPGKEWLWWNMGEDLRGNFCSRIRFILQVWWKEIVKRILQSLKISITIYMFRLWYSFWSDNYKARIPNRNIRRKKGKWNK